ncbi:hypothetical protein [Paenibacillus nasutitermitis]|uniref:Uncharacterized protein n=1 Tax=Paenibacillus nasutitermitis TaxID=1652958 RepID=A0A917DT37_9BACL|nr:hypothetical protein [Paenibacillus nasutitermitis]GGD66162.1 hypothetical protein GCM10010911_24900 [Paenibacillus nasutitermitis]
MAGQEQQALQDIEFIKQLIARNQSKLVSAIPYMFIWGTYLTIGFIGMQFNEFLWPIWYWSTAGVLGGLLSAVTGIRQSRKGRAAKEGGATGWMFWLPFLVILLAGSFMMAAGMIRMKDAAFFWFILIGIVYVTMGPLAGRGPVYLGIWFMALSMLTYMFLVDYQYLLFGLLGGGSILVTGFILMRRRRKHG